MERLRQNEPKNFRDNRLLSFREKSIGRFKEVMEEQRIDTLSEATDGSIGYRESITGTAERRSAKL